MAEQKPPEDREEAPQPGRDTDTSAAVEQRRYHYRRPEKVDEGLKVLYG